MGISAPSHPLITVLPHTLLEGKVQGGTRFAFGVYQVSLKDGIECALGYGRSEYDFKDGSMVFICPNQEVSAKVEEITPDSSGWTIAFHPCLIRDSALGKKIKQYSFFDYETSEALHLSAKEIEIVSGISSKIDYESTRPIDRHTQALLRSNLELLFNYCVRFYDRQFYVRADLNKDHVANFQSLLNDYYSGNRPDTGGIPNVRYFGQELVSPAQ